MQQVVIVGGDQSQAGITIIGGVRVFSLSLITYSQYPLSN